MRTTKNMLVLCAIFFLACKTKNSEITLPLKWGMSEEEQSNKLQEFTSSHFLRTTINEKGDTIYYRDLMLDNTVYPMVLKLNSDKLGSEGILRSYTYHLPEIPYSQSGNDTTNVPKWYINDGIYLASTFTSIKSFLDEKYGSPSLITNTYNVLFNPKDTIYKYALDTVDIYLEHTPTVTTEYYKVASFKVPFYSFADITVTAKDYFHKAEKEKERRISLLTPDDILEIRFDNAKMTTDYDEFGNPKIILPANYERYKSHLVDEDIVEARGIISCLNMYDEVIGDYNVIYKFAPPLVRDGKIGISREYSMINYTVKPFSNEYATLYSELSKNRPVKLKFKPIAVAFADGSVIK